MTMTARPWLDAAIVLAATFVLTVLIGLPGLPLLRRLRVGQTVRDDGPQSHFAKSGTPTFGGFFFLIPLLMLGLVAAFDNRLPQAVAPVVLLIWAFGFIGFLDDLIKVRRNKKGLSMKQKTIGLLLVSMLFAAYYLYGSPQAAFFSLPFGGHTVTITGWLRLPYGLFVVLVLFFTSNSVNLTDGVDGLAASITALNGLFFALLGLFRLPASDPTQTAWLVSSALAGGCLGFLLFNRHPARVFMGDTGSQALGAGLTAIAFLYGRPWLILLPGLIYMLESLSVMIQVAYFKKTGGRRLFRMSPIHHHFELGGWSERKIVAVFSLVTLAGAAIGWLVL